MIHEIMIYLRNYFPTGRVYEGTYEIKDGTVCLPFLIPGQYYLIEGSVLNDGVYQYPTEGLKDEVFTGDIAALAPPPAFLALVEEIEDWQSKNSSKTSSPYQSESFGGYSYTRATGQSGEAYSWKDAFKQRLKAWRKI